MPSTSRATSAFAAHSLLILAMASWGAEAYDKLSKGCYSSVTPLKSQGPDTYQSSGNCQTVCDGLNLPVFALNSDICYCGSELPAADTKTDSSNCDTPCQGYPSDTCGGGSDYYTVWLTGSQTNVPVYSGGGSDSSSPSSPSQSTTSSQSQSTEASTKTTSKTHKQTVITSVGPDHTVYITQPAEAPASSSAAPPQQTSSGGGSTNVAGIAAGVVVGVVAVVSIVAGLIFYLRYRKRKAAEEEYARTQNVPDFLRGGERKPPNTGYSQMSDSRLDPESNKRNSVGSLADDQDYSRRILRVANPDRS